MRKFVKFSEKSDEFKLETYNFYIIEEGNEKFIEFLSQFLTSNVSNRTFNRYKLHENTYDEADVDIIVNNTKRGYMNFHNKWDFLIDLGRLRNDLNKYNEEPFDPFYKAGLVEYFK